MLVTTLAYKRMHQQAFNLKQKTQRSFIKLERSKSSLRWILFVTILCLPLLLSAQNPAIKGIGPFIIHETTGEDIFQLQEQGYSLTYVQNGDELKKAKELLQQDSLAIFKIIPQTPQDTLELSSLDFSGSLSQFSTLYYIDQLTLEGHIFKGVTLLLIDNRLKSFSAKSVSTDLTSMLVDRFGTPEVTDEVLFIKCADQEEKIQEGYVSQEWFTPGIITDFTIQYTPNKDNCTAITSYYFTISDDKVTAENYAASRKQYLRLKAQYGNLNPEEAKYHSLNNPSGN